MSTQTGLFNYIPEGTNISQRGQNENKQLSTGFVHTAKMHSYFRKVGYVGFVLRKERIEKLIRVRSFQSPN